MGPIRPPSSVGSALVGTRKHIAEAVRRATANGVSGKAVTPYLLGQILEITSGESLRTNIALVRHNAEVAARIAVAVKAR